MIMYLPSILFMDEEGNLVKYIQGGDDEAEAEDLETEGEEV